MVKYLKNIDAYEKLPKAFYQRPNVVKIAQELLGKVLFTQIDGVITGGRIVETEAYNGREDKACHAYHRRTPRTEVMYESGGLAYVYLCYGIHHLFNVVTNKAGLADAVLIRAIEPIVGLTSMRERRGVSTTKITSGPGVLSKALGIQRTMTGTDLLGDEIWISRPLEKSTFEIVTDVRVGVDYAEEHALLPWRFYVDGNSYVSRLKKKNPGKNAGDTN